MALNKVISMDDAIAKIKSGDTVMIGGFGVVGTPHKLVDALLSSDIRDITLICNDTAWEDKGLGKLITNNRCKKVIASHIGTNKQTGAKMNAGELDVELVPQGTLAERIRAAAYGLGGILTPTGIGTAVEEGKQKFGIDGKEYLLELPLHADVALVFGAVCDAGGNMSYIGAAANFNNIMAGAAKITIAEAGELLPVGAMNPNQVSTPGIFIDYVVEGAVHG